MKHASLSIEEDLKNLVLMDSQVNNEYGITKVQHYIANHLENLGFQINFHYGAYTSAPLIHAFKKGSNSQTTISFIGHSDVVTSVHKVPFKISDHKIFGAGVADCKGGVIVCLKALENFLKSTRTHDFNINVIISPNEETGSLGFHDFFKQIGNKSQFVFGLEPALAGGELISSRSGNRWYELRVEGISAHSGRFGSNHINAAHGLSKIVSDLHGLSDEGKKRRVNIGSFGGGNGGFNTICGYAWAKIDTRFTNFEDRDYLHAQFELAIEKHIISCPYSSKMSNVFYSIEDDCPPMQKAPALYNWFDVYSKELEKISSKDVRAIHAGGAADINYFANATNQLLDGLGPIGGNLHTQNEYIERESLVHKSNALTSFLKWMNMSKWVTRRH